MQFAFTEEQDMFRDTVRDLFADVCPPEAVRASWDNDDGRVPGLWDALAEMGVLAVLAPEEAGGLGMDEVDLVRILEEAGYAGVPEPLMEHAAVAVPALAQAGSLHLDAAIGGGSRYSISLSTGGGPVLAAGSVDALVAEDDGLLAEVARESYDVVPVESIDQSRRLARVELTGDPTGLSGADAALANDRAALGTAAQCLGVARRLLDATVEYVGERHQFGKPVGSYQAVKHHLANVRIANEFAAPLVYRAAWSVAHPETHDEVTRGRDVSMAKATASDAVDLACRAALQCHGAIGYTFEYDLQLWLKRGWALAAAYGDARRHRDRVAAALEI
ncbi:MAG: acyl-CoA dehydrogenase family protein [Acidimicrobiales bacterium]|nr:acyl-CoA dehydrogenase family protein [Acidimicrobiales bacterium]